MGIQIDLDKCTGCGNCVPVCPFGLLEIVDDKVQLKEGCTLCGACQEACDYEAISIEVVAVTEIPVFNSEPTNNIPARSRKCDLFIAFNFIVTSTICSIRIYPDII